MFHCLPCKPVLMLPYVQARQGMANGLTRIGGCATTTRDEIQHFEVGNRVLIQRSLLGALGRAGVVWAGQQLLFTRLGPVETVYRKFVFGVDG